MHRMKSRPETRQSLLRPIVVIARRLLEGMFARKATEGSTSHWHACTPRLGAVPFSPCPDKAGLHLVKHVQVPLHHRGQLLDMTGDHGKVVRALPE